MRRWRELLIHQLGAQVLPSTDEGEFGMEVSVQFSDEESAEEDACEVVQWAGLPFVYVIAALSFSDARPRCNSGSEFDPRDEFTFADLARHLRFDGGALKLELDYLRGRRVKTDILVRAATATVRTTGRGKAPLQWLAKLRGEGKLRRVL